MCLLIHVLMYSVQYMYRNKNNNDNNNNKIFIILLHVGVTAVGLEAEIMSIEQRIADLDMRLLSLPPHDDKALEITIKLSALEDQLQVRHAIVLIIYVYMYMYMYI